MGGRGGGWLQLVNLDVVLYCRFFFSFDPIF